MNPDKFSKSFFRNDENDFTKWSDSFLQRALYFAQSGQRLYSFLQFTNTASSIFTLWRYPIT